jgi:hypothetical protein
MPKDNAAVRGRVAVRGLAGRDQKCDACVKLLLRYPAFEMTTFFVRSGAAAAALASCMAAVPAHAQDEDAQLWTTTTASFDLSDETTFAAQFVARFSDAAEGLSELQIQADVETGAWEGVKLGAGYSYVPRYNQGRLTSREHRIRQQVSASLGELLGGRLEGRLRLEERWRDDGDDMMLRLRGRLMWTKPIGPRELAVRVGHESFVQLNDTDWGGEAGYSRMRNQLSLRRKLSADLTGELGYLNQYVFANDGPDQVAHALTFALSFDF